MLGASRLKGTSGIPTRWLIFLCAASFFIGMLFTNRMWSIPEVEVAAEAAVHPPATTNNMNFGSEIRCDPKLKEVSPEAEVYEEVSRTHQAIRNLDKKISSLEMELTAARATQTSGFIIGPQKSPSHPSETRREVFTVIGINTAFSGRKRRDSVRETWLPRGEKLKQLEQKKGVIIRFVIGHSATPGGVLDHALEAEEAEHGDFLRLDHVEGYHELSSKTKAYFSAAVAKWDADYYVKIDDDVHLNLGMLLVALGRHRSKPRAYIGCMKSGPVLAQKGVKYHEPEHWKFGEDGNRYFRHATGQVYAISRDLATYVSVNKPILHKYANEDVSLGSWLIGLDVEHIDDRSFCCGTPPDCEWKAQAGSFCVGSFDWTCSGICRSVERLSMVHQRCGEGENTVWNALL